MCRRPLFWILMCVVLLAGIFCCWRPQSIRTTHLSSVVLLTKEDHALVAPKSDEGGSRLHHSTTPPLPLTNTTNTLSQLIRSDHAILLENAWFDTEHASR